MSEIYINNLQDSKYEAWKELIDNDDFLTMVKIGSNVTITFPEYDTTFSCRRTFESMILEFESDDMITILECKPNDFASIVIW